jgi:eukaryotic-like serine/threonine-protein kinase
VALKVLRPELLAADASAREQLLDELRLTRRITHRNVVRTYDIGENDGVPFVTMEYVDGASLATVIRVRGALPVPAVLSMARQLMRAIGAAHREHIVHGDIKPRNLLVGPNGVLKVTDFGVARVLRTSQHVPVAAHTPTAHVTGHVGGAVLGTPEYLAPEVLIGASPSMASDLYAAGVVLHECLIGHTPHDADTPTAFLSGKLAPSGTWRSQPAAVAASPARREDRVPSIFESLVSHLLQPDPDARPASADHVLELLAAIG